MNVHINNHELTEQSSTVKHGRQDSKMRTLYDKQIKFNTESKNQTNKFVFIRVKDRHEYDLNPKLVKFFL